jgi:pilus assembly protein Flp/PilA
MACRISQKGARLAGNMNWALNKEIIMQFVRNILKNSKGATAIEYGLIAALIAVAAISAMTTLGGKIGTTFNSVSSNLK